MISTPEPASWTGPRLHVVLVEPQFPGNIGHVARTMLNFGLTSLHLVNPCPITEETRERAVHAQDVIANARIWDSFPACVTSFDHVVAFSGLVRESDRSHRRTGISIAQHAPTLAGIPGDVALVFGREDDGLNNDHLMACDVVAWIPTSPLYESMNLSHAVAAGLYEVTRERMPRLEPPPASHHEKALLFHHFDHLLGALRFPEHRQGHTSRMFRRLVGRAALTQYEYHRFMGVVTDSLKALGKYPAPPLPEGALDPGFLEAPEDGSARDERDAP